MATGLIQKDKDLLWTNPNPTSNFTEQQISVDLSAYRFYIIFYRQSTSADIMESVCAVVGHGANLSMFTGYSSLIASREANVVSGGLAITSCFSGHNVVNQYCVPVYIYGIKA